MSHLIQLRCSSINQAIELINKVSLTPLQVESLDTQSLQRVKREPWQGQGWKEKLALMRSTLWPTNTLPRTIAVATLLGIASFILLTLYQILTPTPSPKNEEIVLPDRTPSIPEPSPTLASPSSQDLKLTTFSEGVKPPVSGWGVYLPGRGTAKESIVIDTDPVRGKVMRIAFNVPPPKEYAVFYLKFKLSNFRPGEWPVISFWLRSESATKIKLELKLREERWGWKMHYIQVGETWKQHRLRLSDFQTLSSDGWKNTDEFVLTFDNQLTAPSGVIYLDDITFEKQ